jgi:WD40-like Beta Propeller Repeat
MAARCEILHHMRARRPRNRSGLLALGAIAFLALALGAAAPAGAGLPGAANGNIAFVSDRDPLGTGNAQVFVMGPQGENPTNLSTDNSNEGGPAFSPDGSRIAFVWSPDFAEDKYAGDELVLMNADGSNRERLTRTYDSETEPTWSPDGSKIAFVSFPAEGGTYTLEAMNADGSGRTPLLTASDPEAIGFREPAWSPDGTKIAYTDPGGSGDIWVLDLATGTRTQLTNSPNIEGEADWSPDGTKIAYVSDPYILTANSLHSNPDIWTMNADGSDKTRLTQDPQADEEPAWSPDGTKIAYTRRQAETDPQAYFYYPADIHVMNADGSGDQLLLGGPFSDEAPSWQPLGKAASEAPPAFTGVISIPPRLVIYPKSTQALASATAARRHRRRATVRFRLSKRASVKLAVERLSRGRKVRRGHHTVCVPAKRGHVTRRRRCTAGKLVGWIVRRGRHGRNRVGFTGRFGRRWLKAGRYRITAGAVDRRANPARHRRSRQFRIAR